MVVVRTPIQTGDRHRSRTDKAEAEKDTEETGEMGTSRIGERAETTDSVEETGVVAEFMGTPPFSHTTNTDRGNSVENMPTMTEVDRLEG